MSGPVLSGRRVGAADLDLRTKLDECDDDVTAARAAKRERMAQLSR